MQELCMQMVVSDLTFLHKVFIDFHSSPSAWLVCLVEKASKLDNETRGVNFNNFHFTQLYLFKRAKSSS